MKPTCETCPCYRPLDLDMPPEQIIEGHCLFNPPSIQVTTGSTYYSQPKVGKGQLCWQHPNFKDQSKTEAELK